MTPSGTPLGTPPHGGWNTGAPTQWPGQPVRQPGPLAWSPPQPQAWQQPPRAPGTPTALLATLGVAALALVGLLTWSALAPSGPQYQNEDYVPPEVAAPKPQIPIPASDAEADAFLRTNALYAVLLPAPTRCELTLDPSTPYLSQSALETRMRILVTCLTRTWGPALAQAGFEITQPLLTVYDGTAVGGGSPCGKLTPKNAFYCSADQNIYLATDANLGQSSALAVNPLVFEATITHEFGHAIQGRSGILMSEWRFEQRLEERAAMPWSRRLETQADCFGTTVFLSLAKDMGIGTKEMTDVVALNADVGDDVIRERYGLPPEEGDHGTAASRGLWSQRGAASRLIGNCNTWVAPADEIR